MTDVVDDFLAHHGVAGMKWGRRSSKSKTAKTPAQLKKSKARRDLAITVGLGAAMVLSMAVGGIRTSNIHSAQTHQRHDFSDVMGLPMSSVKVSYNPQSNIWE